MTIQNLYVHGHDLHKLAVDGAKARLTALKAEEQALRAFISAHNGGHRVMVTAERRAVERRQSGTARREGGELAKAVSRAARSEILVGEKLAEVLSANPATRKRKKTAGTTTKTTTTTKPHWTSSPAGRRRMSRIMTEWHAKNAAARRKAATHGDV